MILDLSLFFRYVYKIVAKILSRRFKRVLSKVIYQRKTTLLEGKGLLESVSVSNETFEEVKRRKGKCLFLKQDYEKVCDSIRWDFLYMLEKLGFCGKWIEWMRACLEYSSVLVVVNRSPIGEFKSSKGRRQGDPLTPFLFIIAAKGLVGILRQVVMKILLQSMEVGDNKVEVNMLNYADDTLFFYKVVSKML